MQAQRTSAIEAGVEDPLHCQAGVEVVYQPPAVPKRETPHPGSASGTVSSPAPSPGSFARALPTTLASRTHVYARGNSRLCRHVPCVGLFPETVWGGREGWSSCSSSVAVCPCACVAGRRPLQAPMQTRNPLANLPGRTSPVGGRGGSGSGSGSSSASAVGAVVVPGQPSPSRDCVGVGLGLGTGEPGASFSMTNPLRAPGPTQ